MKQIGKCQKVGLYLNLPLLLQLPGPAHDSRDGPLDADRGLSRLSTRDPGAEDLLLHLHRGRRRGQGFGGRLHNNRRLFSRHYDFLRDMGVFEQRGLEEMRESDGCVDWLIAF